MTLQVFVRCIHLDNLSVQSIVIVLQVWDVKMQSVLQKLLKHCPQPVKHVRPIKNVAPISSYVIL